LRLKHFTLDHVIPKSKGGSNWQCNLVACCKRCNTLKSDLSVEEFRPVFIKDYSKVKNIYALEGKFAFEVSPLIWRKVPGSYNKKLIMMIEHKIKERADWFY
jgi:hypothetical protein